MNRTKVLEVFDGYITGDYEYISYVTLVSRLNGDELWGEYPTKEFQGCDSFVCSVIENDDGSTEIKIEPVPDREITDEEAAAIKKEIEIALPNNGVIY